MPVMYANGKAIDVPDDQVAEALRQGFTHEDSSTKYDRLKQERIEEQHGGAFDKYVNAPIYGALRGATMGLSDVAFDALGEGEMVSGLRDVNPVSSGVGEFVGAVAAAIPSGGASLAYTPAATAARVGARVARAAEGASALTKVGRAFAGGATEGAIQGVGSGISELALSKEPLTVEHIASTLGSHALFGGGVGGAAGSLGKVAEIGLGRARKAIDEHIATSATRANVADDIVTQRAQVADEIKAHRQTLKDEKIWLATNNATDRELKEIGKISFDADKQLDRLLNNPKALAEDPRRAVRALQQQEHALERLSVAKVDAGAEDLDVNKLTAAERDAVDVYTGGEYRVVNAHLRGQKHWGEAVGPEYELTRGTVGETVKNLDSMIGRAPRLAEPTTVYRGLLPRAKPYRVGETITDKGFQSTTLNRQTASGFAQGLDGKGRVFEIELPAGTRALDASTIMGGAEAEFLLARGAKFQITEITDDVVRARLKAPKVKTGAETGSARAAALEKVPAALERNRALQARLNELGATAPAGAGEKGIAEQMLQGSAFSATAGVASMIPFVGPLVAPFIGAKAAKLVGEQVFGRLGKAAGEASTRAARAASKVLEVAEGGMKKAAPLAVPVATKVLAQVRYAPERDTKPANVNAPNRGDLPALFAARSQEIRSQTMYGPDGRAVMRPEARLALGDTLKPIAAADPLLADRIETIAARKLEVLANALPRKPDILATTLGGTDHWKPSDMEIRAWARLAAAVEDPVGVLERVSDGLVTTEDVQAMREVYPEMLADFTQQIVGGLATRRIPLPYGTRVALSLLTGRPLDPAMDPRILGTLQQQFATEEVANEGAPGPTAKPQFGSVEKQEPTPGQVRAG